MKKLLGFFGALALTSTSVASVVSCDLITDYKKEAEKYVKNSFAWWKNIYKDMIKNNENAEKEMQKRSIELKEELKTLQDKTKAKLKEKYSDANDVPQWDKLEKFNELNHFIMENMHNLNDELDAASDYDFGEIFKKQRFIEIIIYLLNGDIDISLQEEIINLTGKYKELNAIVFLLNLLSNNTPIIREKQWLTYNRSYKNKLGIKYDENKIKEFINAEIKNYSKLSLDYLQKSNEAMDKIKYNNWFDGDIKNEYLFKILNIKFIFTKYILDKKLGEEIFKFVRKYYILVNDVYLGETGFNEFMNELGKDTVAIEVWSKMVGIFSLVAEEY